MASNVSFGVLGPVEAWAWDQPLHLGTPQQRAVLAVILLNEGRVTSTDEIVEALWDGEPPAGATKTVRTYVSRLRAVLEPAGAAIETAAGGYLLRTSPQTLDLARFHTLVTAPVGDRTEQARQALKLFRGEPLAGLTGAWAETQRARLTYLRAAALETRFAAELDSGHHTDVIAEITGAIKEFPFRERLRELHILALYQSGLRAEAFAAYRTVLELLDDELGVAPMPELQQLHQRMLEGDPTLTPAQQLPAPEAEPRQLPPQTPAFVGREALVAELTGLLRSPDKPVLIGIEGLAGTGKTALAVHVSTLVRDDYPDGQIFIDLGGSGDRPIDPATALQHLISHFGVQEGAVPPQTSCRTQLWRNLLAQRRVLVVLDDAASSAQVELLLPDSPGSAAIITGWRRLDGIPGLHTTTVGVFPPDEAWRFLEQSTQAGRLSRDPQPVNRLIALFSGHPAALGIVAGSLAADPRTTAADAERRFRHEFGDGGDFAEVERLIRRPYTQLQPGTQQAIRLLAGLDLRDMSLDTVAHALDVSHNRARHLMTQLREVHLVEENGPGRYRLLDLIRFTCRRWSLESDEQRTRDAVLRRTAGYFATMSALATSGTFTPSPLALDMGPAARAWLQAESRNAGMIVAQAATHERDRRGTPQRSRS
ncbi:hypothetical protein GCM10010435_27070 [Winogradskya consettensis]|uniref:OmpR/PhoB-type domain-containing protein n=1 Tax=Winogradskya consettensis TaxID=113560 RepID=A0A919VLY0_9ACTN|nr:BTAD domain-containing putative transcriptional regulator [Actinoplanes consettensis]GIM68227.1 hypothetical protein Aco04nite_09860 [Actinoplanes consettensis]